MVQQLKCVALAADSLSHGDMVEKLIRKDSRWELLPLQVCVHVRAHVCEFQFVFCLIHSQSFLSSVIPGEHMKGGSYGRPMFPRWLGKYSKTNSNNKSLQDLQQHTRLM